MTTRYALALLSTLVAAGCGSNGAKTVSDDKVHAAKSRYTELDRKWQKEPAELRQSCEISDGDCMMLAKERRYELVEEGQFPECSGDLDARTSCEDQRLMEEGQGAGLVEYYDYGSWCAEKLMECVANVRNKKATEVKQAMTEDRTKALLESSKTAELNLKAEIAKERVSYLRSTLPKDSDTVCMEVPAAKECRTKAEQQDAMLQDELTKSDEDYNAATAAQLFEEAHATVASCYEPEFECLSEAIKEYGGAKQSERVLNKNLKVLEERLMLAHRVPTESAEQCLDGNAKKYEKNIVSAYAKYVKRSNQFNRILLLNQFLKLHKSQVRCLTSKLD